MSKSPNGFPNAITHSPMMTSSEFPSLMYGKLFPSIFRRAMSATWSVPIRSALYFSPFVRVTVISLAFPATMIVGHDVPVGGKSGTRSQPCTRSVYVRSPEELPEEGVVAPGLLYLYCLTSVTLMPTTAGLTAATVLVSHSAGSLRSPLRENPSRQHRTTTPGLH